MAEDRSVRQQAVLAKHLLARLDVSIREDHVARAADDLLRNRWLLRVHLVGHDPQHHEPDKTCQNSNLGPPVRDDHRPAGRVHVQILPIATFLNHEARDRCGLSPRPAAEHRQGFPQLGGRILLKPGVETVPPERSGVGWPCARVGRASPLA